nr:28S ribosomal protein S31, mitochondrial isoform X3 [Parasteatoda tepidariorum]
MAMLNETSTCQIICRYFSSKDTSDINSTKIDSDQSKQDKEKEEKSPDEKLYSSKEKNNEDEKKEAAKKKLFSLLSELKVSPDQSKIKPDLVLSKPLKRISKQERFSEILKEKKSPDEKIIQAVKAVAEKFGEDALETQNELKQKLSSLNLISEDSQSDKKVSDNVGISEKIQEELMSSVEDVASTVPSPIKSKLTHRLLKLSVERKDSKQAKISMENMMKGLKIEKPQKETQKSSVPDVKLRERKMIPKSRSQSEINIFQAPPLNIFSTESESKEELPETVWERLERKKLKLLTEYAPANAFEEMIMWTEQGKHWKFPIDNETEMGEEENVGFHEHVFLDQHLHGFPTRGPIRHFIELVAVGLSTNPYISVERKIENIDWFRNYFKEKEEILKQCGALE